MFSNWANTSSWKVIDDPTGVLNGKVLSATSSSSTRVSEILIQNIGTSSDFSVNNYSIKCNYAFQQDWQFASGVLEIMSRVSYTSSTVNDCYFAGFNIAKNIIFIGSLKDDVEEIIVQAKLPYSVIERVSKHELEFRTIGTESVSLELYIDNELILSASDNSLSKITSGYPAISVKSGTVYIDSFQIERYTVDGGEPTNWQLSDLTESQALYLQSGYASEGATFTWSDQSGNSNDATNSVVANQPQVVDNSLNDLDVVTFDSGDYLTISDSNSLDLESTGATFFFILKRTSASATTNLFIKRFTYAVYIASSGEITFTGDPSDTTVTTTTLTTNKYQLISITSNRTGSTDYDKHSIFIDGSRAADISFGLGTDNTQIISIADTGPSGVLIGDLVEVLLVEGELSIADRQRVEGFLCHKFALQNNLPSSHPYRENPPKVDD